MTTSETDSRKLNELRKRVGFAMQAGKITAAQQLAILEHSRQIEEQEGIVSAIRKLQNSIDAIESGNWS